MTKKYFIGIDVSKHTLDVAFIIHHQSCFTNPVWKQFENSSAGLKQMHRWLTDVQCAFVK